MQRIYAHISRDYSGSHFNPEYLRSSEQSNLGVRDKPFYGLWASPFNDPKSCQWEWYLATEMNKNAHKRERALEEAERTRFEMYLHSRGLTRNQYYNLPSNQFQQINSDYKQLQPAYTKEEMTAARVMDYKDQLSFAAAKRECAFHFTVDQSKILHVHSLKDVWSYMKHNDAYSMWQIDFDLIKDAGYDGMELHNATSMRNTVFWSWDVDSIVVWNPDCVKPIPKEIAYIARSISGAKNEFDAQDWLSDDVTLCTWIANNISVIEHYIKEDVLDPKAVARFIEQAIDLDNQRRGLNDKSPDVKSEEQDVTIGIER